jgi:hypothetical protein
VKWYHDDLINRLLIDDVSLDRLGSFEDLSDDGRFAWIGERWQGGVDFFGVGLVILQMEFACLRNVHGAPPVVGVVGGKCLDSSYIP